MFSLLYFEKLTEMNHVLLQMEDSFVTEGSDGCLENEDLRAKT